MEDHKIRVSIVDDHPVIRSALRMFLERVPEIKVAGEAANGKEAIQMVQNDCPDVIILDLSMPGMGGMEVIRALRQVGNSVYIIVFSAINDRETITHILNSGANEYFVKDTDIHRLVSAIRKVRVNH